MSSRADFTKALGGMSLSHVERAIALLWYYRQTQEYEERTASELANDLHDEGFPKPNVTRLKQDLAKSSFAIRGRRPGSLQIDVRQLSSLEDEYGELLLEKRVEVGDSIVPRDWVAGTRVYLEKLVHQINGCYENGFYDACATQCRRLMESVSIEIYIAEGRHHEIRVDGVFFPLSKLIKHIRDDPKLTLGCNTPKTMDDVKQLGDTAAHDRTYVTSKQDLDEIKPRYRRMMQDLLSAARIVRP